MNLRYFSKFNHIIFNSSDKDNDSTEDFKQIYKKISGLGHEKSIVRKEVSIDDLYMLYYHTINRKEIEEEQYQNILKSLEVHIWNDWKYRYNQRFFKLIFIDGDKIIVKVPIN